MNWDQFKDTVSHMCLTDTVIVSWSLTEEVAGSNNLFKQVSIPVGCIPTVPQQVTEWPTRMSSDRVGMTNCGQNDRRLMKTLPSLRSVNITFFVTEFSDNIEGKLNYVTT